MLSGFYTAASGMLMKQRELNILSNNLTNQKTPGYRAERLISTTFEQELTRLEGGTAAAIGRGAPIRILSEVTSAYGSGVLVESDQPYDLAINGEGYFNIQGAENLYLTRNGSFRMDEEGYLALEGAGRVQGTNGDIRVGSSDFTVSRNGDVFAGDGTPLGTILVTIPEEADLLQKTENGMYVYTGEQAMTVPEDTTLIQYAYEKSNIDFNRELTMLMDAQRSFQSCSVILKGLDAINQKAASQIGSIS